MVLLRPPYRERTVRLWFVYGLSAMLLYFLMTWLPAFLTSAGWSRSQAPHGIALLQFGGILGSLAQSWLVGPRPRRRRAGGRLQRDAGDGAAVCRARIRAAWPVLLVLMGSGVAGVVMSIIALGAIFYPRKSA